MNGEPSRQLVSGAAQLSAAIVVRREESFRQPTMALAPGNPTLEQRADGDASGWSANERYVTHWRESDNRVRLRLVV